LAQQLTITSQYGSYQGAALAAVVDHRFERHLQQQKVRDASSRRKMERCTAGCWHDDSICVYHREVHMEPVKRVSRLVVPSPTRLAATVMAAAAADVMLKPQTSHENGTKAVLPMAACPHTKDVHLEQRGLSDCQHGQLLLPYFL
jgi:hypothetical protein